MPWVYTQSSGDLYRIFPITPISLNRISVGYSGNGEGRNNYKMEAVKDVGPIPAGTYSVETPIDTSEHGPFVLPLTPNAKNTMFDRSGFLIHGDSVEAPGCASKGCIIFQRIIRELIWQSGDHDLTVIR